MKISQVLCIGLIVYVIQLGCTDKIDHNFVEGNWNCLDCKDYTEMQIYDSVYFFIQENDYFGLVKPYEYKIVMDSLFVIDEINHIRFTFILNSKKETLAMSGASSDLTNWSKFDTNLRFSNWSKDANEEYKKQLLKRKSTIQINDYKYN